MLIDVFEELKANIRASGLPLKYLAHRSNVDRYTIYQWLIERTQAPRIDTMLRVATVLGQHIELTGNLKKMVNYYPRREIKPPPVVKIGMSRHTMRMTMMKFQ